MRNFLEVCGLHAGYGEIEVLRDVNITIAQSKITAIIGSNGAGKTTLMRAISGLIYPARGQILFGGDDISRVPTHRRVDMGIALVPEGRLVFPELTVHETLRVGAFAKRAHNNWEERRDEMYEVFPRLKSRRRSMGGSLSGGEQQMLVLARGLMCNPVLLLLDEPSLGLSPSMTEEVLDRLDVIRGMGTTICLVEQNIHSSLMIADWAYVLENGHVSMDGKGTDLLQVSAIRSSYLGM